MIKQIGSAAVVAFLLAFSVIAHQQGMHIWLPGAAFVTATLVAFGMVS
jgi:hypothetical protein